MYLTKSTIVHSYLPKEISSRMLGLHPNSKFSAIKLHIGFDSRKLNPNLVAMMRHQG